MTCLLFSVVVIGSAYNFLTVFNLCWNLYTHPIVIMVSKFIVKVRKKSTDIDKESSGYKEVPDCPALLYS
jgi:hypothetical protein